MKVVTDKFLHGQEIVKVGLSQHLFLLMKVVTNQEML